MTDAPLSALIARLVVASCGRAPSAEEDAAIANERASSLQEVPAVYLEALEALLAQGEVERPITQDDAGWSWTLQIVAQLVPGAALVWDGNTMKLTLPGHPLALLVDSGPAAGYRVGLPIVKRLGTDTEGRHVIHVTPELEPLLVACEVHCVAGCCGTSAFGVATHLIRNWIEKSSPDAGRTAARHLDDLLYELAHAPERPVVSHRFNAVWARPDECVAYLSQWRTCLAEALAS